MKRMTMPLLMLGLAGALGGSAVAEDEPLDAWQPPRVNQPAGKRHDGRHELNLTEAQRAELKKFRAEHREKRIRAQADRRVLEAQIDDMIGAATVDENAVRAKAAQLERLRAAEARDRLEARLALRRILGPELMQKMRARRHHHRQRKGDA